MIPTTTTPPAPAPPPAPASLTTPGGQHDGVSGGLVEKEAAEAELARAEHDRDQAELDAGALAKQNQV
eukprot:1084173-Rhodomonas_salina.1